MKFEQPWFYLILQIATFCCFLFLVAIQLLSANPFPYSDEWHLLPYALGDKAISWQWLWAPWVDHRIPLQKLLQAHLLRFSGGDARILVFANAVFVYLLAVFLMHSARAYRGESQLGDLLIPVLLLNPGFGTFRWGFHFQFTSSVLFSLISVALLFLYAKSHKRLHYALSIASLLALAVCGMNGAIMAALISVVFLLPAAVLAAKASNPKLLLARIWYLVPLVFSGFVILSWTPSPASALPGGASFPRVVLEIIWHWMLMMSPRASVLPPGPVSFYYLMNLSLYIFAGVILVKHLRSDYHSSADFSPGKLALA